MLTCKVQYEFTTASEAYTQAVAGVLDEPYSQLTAVSIRAGMATPLSWLRWVKFD